MQKNRILLGLDPGLATVGFAVIKIKEQSLEILDYGVITTDTKLSFEERLFLIEKDLKDLIQRFEPDCAFVEELFFSVNTKTAMNVAHARGVILATLASENIPVKMFTPNQIKLSVTGDGSADKIQIQTMLKRHFSLRTFPKPDDAADAIAVAYCGFLHFF